MRCSLCALDVPVLRHVPDHVVQVVARDPEVHDLGRQARRGVVCAHARLDELDARLPVALARRGQLARARGDGDGQGLRAAGHGPEHERAPEEADEMVLFRHEAP